MIDRTDNLENGARAGSPVLKALGRLLVYLVVLVLGVLIYLSTLGCPEWLAHELVKRLDLGVLALETGTVKLHLVKGIILKDARLYRKRVVGPPALEAGQLEISIDLLAPMKENVAVVRKVTIRDAEFRPELLAGPETNAPVAPVEPPVHLPDVRFRVELEACRIWGVTLEQLRCQLSLKGEEVLAEELGATVAGAGKRGDIRKGRVAYHVGTGVLDIGMEAQLDPHALLPLLEECNMPETAAVVRDFEFGPNPPRCDVKIVNGCTPEGALRVDTKFWFQDGKYEGVDLLRADGAVRVDFSPTNGTIAVRPLFVVRKEGTGSGGFTIDLDHSTVDFEGASTLDPRAVLKMIGILTNGVLEEFRFDGQVNVTGKGIANYSDLTQTRLDLQVAGRDLGWSRLKVADYRLDINVNGLTNALNNISARFYDGDLTGRAVFVVSPDLQGDTSFMASGLVSHVSFERFMKDVEKGGQLEQEYSGRLSATLNLSGLLGATNTGTIRGGGTLRVKEGKVLLLPLFGGLTKILTDYIPGLDFVVNQTDVKTEFKVARNKIHTEKVYIEGSVIRLEGDGDYRFDNTLDFRVQVKLLRHQSILSYLTDPVMWVFSKFFEFRLEGDVTDPRWAAFSSTTDLLETIGLKKKDKDKKDKDKKDKSPPDAGPAPPKTPVVQPEDAEPAPPDEE